MRFLTWIRILGRIKNRDRLKMAARIYKPLELNWYHTYIKLIDNVRSRSHFFTKVLSSCKITFCLFKFISLLDWIWQDFFSVKKRISFHLFWHLNTCGYHSISCSIELFTSLSHQNLTQSVSFYKIIKGDNSWYIS